MDLINSLVHIDPLKQITVAIFYSVIMNFFHFSQKFSDHPLEKLTSP